MFHPIDNLLFLAKALFNYLTIELIQQHEFGSKEVKD